MDPQRLVLVSVRSFDLAGIDLSKPGDVVMLGMHAPARMIADHQQRVLLSPLRVKRLLMALPLRDPVGHRRPLLVSGEMLSETGGVELQFAGRSGQGMALRILIEFKQPSGDLLPLRINRDHEVALFVQFLPRYKVGGVRLLVAQFDQLGNAPAFRVLLQQPQPLGDQAHDLVVTLRLAQRLHTLVLGKEQVHLPTEQITVDVVFFQLGVDRQDDVGKKTIILQPRVLGEHELDGRVA